jgi:hypothetical protein
VVAGALVFARPLVFAFVVTLVLPTLLATFVLALVT